MNKLSTTLVLALGLLCVASCGEGGSDDPIINPTPNPNPNPTPTPDPTPTPTPTPIPQGAYHELYRPQIHYTPIKNWVNDPNGMVYVNGTWHLFYQYNPYGNDWGNMSWGHATSTDLMHWKEQATALVKDDLGDIFSGSAVVDKNNTAGYGENAVIAFYTSAGAAGQQQSMAYSTDGGMTFKKYEANPIIPNSDDKFRDPKVFWHEPSNKWVMCLALGEKGGIDIWTSADTRSWKHASTFTSNVKHDGRIQWECPDLIQLDYKDGKKWVLIVNINPGGPKGGSGIMCFIGDFDGETFTADDLDYPMWMDFGMDNYAGVTWSNAPGDRKILLGWMNNWMYAGNVPCDPWRSAFTLPRELSLVEVDGKPTIASKVVKEIENIAKQWQPQTGTNFEIPASSLSAYHLQMTLSTSEAMAFTLSNEKGEKYECTFNNIYHQLCAKRTFATGAQISSFSIPSVDGNLYSSESAVTLDIYVDQSSVEIFSADGTTAMTNLVFPSSIYNQISVPASATNVQYRTLDSIW